MIIEMFEPKLKLRVKETEKAGRQTKFFGEIIEAGPQDWKEFEGQDFETPFLYKSGFRVISR
jgi:hypothetical protein